MRPSPFALLLAWLPLASARVQGDGTDDPPPLFREVKRHPEFDPLDVLVPREPWASQARLLEFEPATLAALRRDEHVRLRLGVAPLEATTLALERLPSPGCGATAYATSDPAPVSALLVASEIRYERPAGGAESVPAIWGLVTVELKCDAKDTSCCSYAIRSVPGTRYHVLLTIDDAAPKHQGSCGVVRYTNTPPAPPPSGQGPGPPVQIRPLPPLRPQRIDVLVVYTEAALEEEREISLARLPAVPWRVGRQWARTQLHALAQFGVAQTQRALSNSGTHVAVRLRATEPVRGDERCTGSRVRVCGGTEESGSCGYGVLDRLIRHGEGDFDAVHAQAGGAPGLRDLYGADLVCMIGRGYEGPQSDALPYWQADGFACIGDPPDQDFAFSIVTRRSIQPSTTMPHEIGHNLGCSHEGLGGTDDYAHAFEIRNPRTQATRGTLMHSAAGCSFRVLHFSDARRKYTWASGEQSDMGGATADNVLMIVNNAPAISGYRSSR